MTVRFVLSSISGQFTAAMEKANTRIATCATSAIREAAELAKKNARASIASGGFSSRWQKALQATTYPKSGVSVSPAAVIQLKIPYGDVFEEGKTIAGRPMLWLPLPEVPLGRGGKQLTPEQFTQNIGNLISVNNPGRPPMLFGRSFKIKRITNKKVTYRSRTPKQDSLGQLIPMYIGVPSVSDPKKYNVIEAIKQAADRVPEFYVKAFEQTNG